MRTAPLSFVLAVLLALSFSPQTALSQAAAQPARVHALLVAGSPGTPLFARHYQDWLSRFAACIRHAAGKDLGELVILCDSLDLPGSAKVDVEAIKESLARLAAKAAPQDQFILVLLGHASSSGALVVPGPDLAPVDLAEFLKPLAARRQIVVQFSACSGAAIAPLARPGRIIITSNSALQTGDSDFAEFFLLALEGKITNSATRPAESQSPSSRSLLSVFNMASHEYAQWITRQRQTEGGWVVEGRQSRAIFERLYGGESTPASRKPDPNAPPAGEDVVLPLTPSVDAAFWTGRRLVTEQPLLEDAGGAEGVAALGGEGYKPVQPSSPEGAGALAQSTVLGKPAAPIR